MAVAVVLTYDATNARVVINATGLVGAATAVVQRSTNQVTWTTVRGAAALAVNGSGVLTQVYDYEFTPGVANYYRVTPDKLQLVQDLFGRTVSNGMGSATSGQAYTVQGTTSVYAATGSAGTITPAATNTDYSARLNAGQGAHVRAQAKVKLSALPTSSIFQIGLVLRGTDTSNWYVGKLSIATGTGAVTLIASKRVAGVATDFATLASSTLTVGTNYQLKVELTGTAVGGNTLSVKWWPDGGLEPAAYQLVAQDLAGQPADAGTLAALFARTGAAAFTPVATFDDFYVWDMAPAATTSSITPTVEDVWFKSINRPFLNQIVQIVAGSSISFTRPARSGVNGVKGRSMPVAVTDVRLAPNTTVMVRTENTDDTQTMEYLLASGDVVFVQVPHGCRTVLSGYFVIGDASEDFHPLRPNRVTFTLPMTQVAGPGPYVVAAESTWASVLAAYATWSAVLADNPTWADLLARRGDPAEVIVP